MNRSSMLHLFMAVLFVAAISARAQDKSSDTKAPAKGIKAEMLSNIARVEKQIEDLAGAMPADSYTWRPMEGVRSVGEVYVHIADANYMFAGFVGVKAPEDLPKDAEKTVTDKDKITALLKASFTQIKNAIINTSDEDMEKTTKMFGSESSYRNVFLTTLTHMHEHLGQSIAYARSNKVVPPWTAAENAEAAKKSGK